MTESNKNWADCLSRLTPEVSVGFGPFLRPFSAYITFIKLGSHL